MNVPLTQPLMGAAERNHSFIPNSSVRSGDPCHFHDIMTEEGCNSKEAILHPGKQKLRQMFTGVRNQHWNYGNMDKLVV